jgi:glucosyl-dolichyl phosphate glucuronosyltransferase
MKVTVAICTYNRAALLRQALAGMVTQDLPANEFEILVVDNNSKDSTQAVIASFAGSPVAPRSVIESRQGANFARNRALAEARGEVIVYADDDILVEPSWLRLIVAPFFDTPVTASVAGRGEAGPGSTTPATTNLRETLPKPVRRIGAVAGEVIPVFPEGRPDWVAGFHGPQGFRSDAGPIDPSRVPMSANLAFRRTVLQELGGFDTRFTREGGALFSADENVIMRKLHLAGYEAWFVPEACVQHQMPASRTTFKYVAKHAFGSARSRVVDRATQPGAKGYLLARWPANLLKAVGFVLTGTLNLLLFRSSSAKKAFVRAWRSCGYLYQIPRSLVGKL